ncbi:hypothetical protein C2S51_030278 [Perilla frutescens var. frutescens]|nr:hypothetical protein C2S51_030278 [Perilla frutescens var. frutescens]
MTQKKLRRHYCHSLPENFCYSCYSSHHSRHYWIFGLTVDASLELTEIVAASERYHHRKFLLQTSVA